MLGASRQRTTYDHAPAYMLRDTAAAAANTTGFETSIAVANAPLKYWEVAPTILIPRGSDVEINVKALTGTPSIELWLASTADMVTNATKIGSIAPLTVGTYRMGIDVDLIAQFSGNVFCAVKNIAAGQSITYGATIVPTARA